MPAKFVLRKGRTGKFSFVLLGPTGQTLATSGDYATKRAALAGVQSVRRNASGAGVEDATAPATTGKKATAKKATAKKAPARKAAKKTTAKTTAKKAPAKKSTAKKAPARKAPAKKSTARRTGR